MSESAVFLCFFLNRTEVEKQTVDIKYCLKAAEKKKVFLRTKNKTIETSRMEKFSSAKMCDDDLIEHHWVL